MISVFGILFGVVMIAVLAIGVAFLLDVTLRSVGWKKRSLIAGFVATAVPMMVPIGTILSTASGDGNLVILLLPLIVGIGLMTVLVGFPAAYFFTRRREQNRDAASEPKIFD
ncbi:hypothetical protein HKD42_06215 [Altererythrobacter sp. RZ02]|uniref:Uncharacterized protein n=1 Tax=Pontixanthobacter rizhaonensis TaxID=2730337 RepID=A0A848QLP8_9SPHN|nr:hypothetical protein [Pontixanthobacter rizhaonensis]NMW31650.1 hypothetical protein [Pontixanthobacter rizhaonensis]